MARRQHVKEGTQCHGSKFSAGQVSGGFTSYGYIKADDEKHTPLIDEDAAVIVRRIFEQRARGLSPKQIAIQLNKDGIATPSDHRYQLKGKDNPLCDFTSVE